VRKTVAPRIKNGRIVFDELHGYDEIFKKTKKIYIVACGSAYHVGAHAKYTLEKLTGIPVEAALASEFRYSEPLVDENTLVIVISQSGETLDSMAALREAKRRGGRTLAIVNVIGSSIAREADTVLYTWAGPEIAVATTKAYSTQMALITMLGVYAADLLGRLSREDYTAYLSGLHELPVEMSRVLEDQEQIKSLAKAYSSHRSVFYIGRNVDFALGLEGSLKLKEISYIHSESYAAGELKHGTISLIEPGVLVVALATHAPLFEKTRSNVAEVKSRGADVIFLTTDDLAKDAEEISDTVITIPGVHPLLAGNLAILPLQLFAYYVALERGCDIDKPRNLAKSVTVE
jgi:glucosamine--fructose-6-phosphate aminotransferase (isomerizing)